MVNIARTIPGVLGERMLGGGDKAPNLAPGSKLFSETRLILEFFTPKLGWSSFLLSSSTMLDIVHFWDVHVSFQALQGASGAILRPDAEQSLRNAVDTGYKRSYPQLADTPLK